MKIIDFYPLDDFDMCQWAMNYENIVYIVVRMLCIFYLVRYL